MHCTSFILAQYSILLYKVLYIYIKKNACASHKNEELLQSHRTRLGVVDIFSELNKNYVVRLGVHPSLANIRGKKNKNEYVIRASPRACVDIGIKRETTPILGIHLEFTQHTDECTFTNGEIMHVYTPGPINSTIII